jgi:hypothetical protein
MMIVVKYPEPEFRIKKEKGTDLIFDQLRKKWVALTPEEWVRQNFVQYLIREKKYPASLIAIEKEILLGDLRKRFDVLVYTSNHRPWMIIECKSAGVKLSKEVFEQVLRYNISVPSVYLVITNGNETVGWLRQQNRLEIMKELPSHE